MTAPISSPSPAEGKRSRNLRRFVATIAIGLALITAVILAELVELSFKRASADSSGLALLANTAIGTINSIPTVGGFGLAVAFCALYYWFRQTREAKKEDDGAELLSRARRLEEKGHVAAALASYEHIARTYSHLPVGRSAQVSFDRLQVKTKEKNA